MPGGIIPLLVGNPISPMLSPSRPRGRNGAVNFQYSTGAAVGCGVGPGAGMMPGPLVAYREETEA